MNGSGGVAALLLSGMTPLPPMPAPAAPVVPSPAPERVQYAEVTIRERVERVIVRIRTGLLSPASTPRYKEKKAPRCIPATAIAAAAVTEPDSVDFVLKGGDRVRAKLDSDCPALDYYSGFYLRPTADQAICADRDSLHARSGGECAITRFRKLVPPGK